MEDLCASSCSSTSSKATVQHRKVRSFSTNSLSSVSSLIARRYHGESTQRSSSALNLTLSIGSRRWSGSSALTQGLSLDSDAATDYKTLRLVDVAESADESESEPEEGLAWEECQAVEKEPEVVAFTEPETCLVEDAEEPESSPEPKAFRRWVSTLRKKRARRAVPLTPRTQRWTLDDFETKPASPRALQRTSQHHKHSSYGSSVAFVTAVRSATATIASASMATASKRNSKWRRAQHSSLLSGSDPRPSTDTQRSVIDEAARARSRKRREKVDELIRTEEGYVADLKALSNALYTILGYQPDSQSCARKRASTTLFRLISLHEDVLAHLRHVIPFADCERPPLPTRGHHRWCSVDGSFPTRKAMASVRRARRSLNLHRSSDDETALELLCEPNILAAVAGVFGKRIALFSEYEQFGGVYELIRGDIDQTSQSMAAWPEYDSAIETLAYAINPVQSRDANKRKALRVKDLLIKPIQRLPRYELLFNDLCKLTPVCDDPDCHATLEQLLVAINRACRLMNQARDDHSALKSMETTWLVGERLSFSSQVPRSVFLQLLGQVMLCGCLHIAYRTRDRVQGCYTICILFETTLLLAVAPEDQHQRYSTLAGIALANTTIAECDNMKGLQCYTAPHSWKLVFEHSAKMYEIIFSACSAPEKDAWLSRISSHVSTQTQAVAEGARNIFELHSPILTSMRSIGRAFGSKPGSFLRRMSPVHRAATVGPTTDVNQVIIKNTPAVKETLETSSTASLPIGRSQTVAGPTQVQTLAPRRAERVRLETLLSDVWSKDILPHPGMTTRRTDDFRASANHVMRKFSMASIASNFSSTTKTTKRNASHTSMASSRPHHNHKHKDKDKEDTRSCEVARGGDGRLRKHARPPLVDFHNAPDAFLPEDFGLQDPAKRKVSAFRTFTLGIERPFTPLLGENRPVGVKRAQSVREEVLGGGEEGEGEDGEVEGEEGIGFGREGRAGGGEGWAARKVKSRNRLFRLFA